MVTNKPILYLIQTILLLLLSSCNFISETKFKGPANSTFYVSTVSVLNDQLIINGSGFSKITNIKVKNASLSFDQDFSIESKSNNQLIANGLQNLNLVTNNIFDLILSSAEGASTFAVTFTISNGSITASMLDSMGALSGQVLKFNGTNWAPASLIDAQVYKGTWDPATLIPDIGLSSPGDYWIISAAGTYAGNGITYAVGDWIVSDGTLWSKLALSTTSVASFNGRKGLVNLIPGDYPNLKSGNKIPGSNLNDLANVDITTVAPVVGDVLKWNGSNWIAGVGGAAVVGSAEITDLSITGADIAENTINPSKIYSASIDSALYLRGDKTWANFTAEVLNAPLATYSLNATVKPTVTATDKIGPALGKIQIFLNDLNTDYVSKTASAQAVSGTFSFTSPTSFLYTQTPTGVTPTEVTNVQYVNNYVGAALSGITGIAPVTLTTANGITTSGDTTLNVVSTSAYPTAGTLLVGSEAITYTGTTGTSFTGLTRGAYGTTAATITNGITIDNYLILARSTTNVTPKMVVTGSGRTGIGTSAPLATFHVKKTLPTGTISSSGTSVTGTGTNFTSSLSIGDVIFSELQFSTITAIASDTNLTTSTVFSPALAGYAYSKLGTILNSGNVGIGTDTPSSLLDVEGSRSVGRPIVQFTNSATSTGFRFYGIGGMAILRSSSGHDLTIQNNNGTTPEAITLSMADHSIRFGTNMTEKMRIDTSGNVGINTTAPSEKLHVFGNLRVQGSTDCTLGTGSGGTNCSSDIRLKENIQAIKNPLNKILSLKGVEFDWNEKSNSPGTHAIGVIAQDVEKVFPTAVIEDKSTGYKKVDYAVLVAPMIQAFKDLDKFIRELFKISQESTHEIEKLNEKNTKIDSEISMLKFRAHKAEQENKVLRERLEKIEKLLLKN